MTRIIPALAALSLFAGAAVAQTTPPPSTTTPTTPPTTIEKAPSVSPIPTSPSGSTMSGSGVTLTDEQAKSWINKTVYSSDNKNLGEVAAFARDSSGKVIEMHADIGGFLGLGESRIRLMPNQFTLDGDKVMLTLTAEQAKAMPQIAKQ